MADSSGPSAAGAHAIIGDAIRRLRTRAGYSLQELGARSGVSYQYLCGIETGKENFSIGVLEKIARALDLPLVAIIGAAYGQGMMVGFVRSRGGGEPALKAAAEG